MKNKTKNDLYDKVNPTLNFVDRELKVIEFWKKKSVFEKSVKNRAQAAEFSFFDGPPTANGKPHVGHVLTRVIKDVIPRYKTMKGFKVQRKAGWDTHGLPVELEVEKFLGLDGKQDIEEYGVQKFVEQCKQSVFKYKLEWEKMSERVGYWVDMKNPYITYDDKYIESVWWSLSQIYSKGLLYKGFKILPYCSRCGTTLSSHEVAQGYKNVEDRTAVVEFELENNDRIVAWTTTPWTLPSNVALCVNPDFEYVLIKVESPKDKKSDTKRYWIAKKLADKFFENFTVIEIKKGIELKGKQYKPLYPKQKTLNDTVSHMIVCDNFVTLDSGTGVVHIAPAYGEDDARVGKDNNLPFVQLVDEQGKFKEGQFANLKFKEADKHILKDLKYREQLLKEIKYAHSYPHCWRCDSALMYFARSSWFVAMSRLREKLTANNDKINWMPLNIGQGRMGNFLNSVIDWGISRERYWGTPLPIWQCKCGNIKVISSKRELVELSKCDANIELHKPFVDEVTIPCECGKPMLRTSEVLDCWYDSGCMPFAQFNYPYSGKESFENVFPADFISEAVDQTRGWFYTLLAISTVLFSKAPFKNCIVLGHVLDKQGVKMSKHKGNVVDTWHILNNQGADAVRWYFLSNSAPWLPSKFAENLISESSRKFIGTLWNVYSFYILYANIDKFNPTKHKLEYDKLAMMDKWILSLNASMANSVDNFLSEYKLTEATRILTEFCDKLSNWYIRRTRDRFWGSEWNQDKQNAFMTLYTVIHTLVKVAAPFVPFITECIWQNAVCKVDKNEQISVHLTDFPNIDKKYIDVTLQDTMNTVLTIVENGRAARSQANIKNRQPLSKAYVGSVNINLSSELTEIIKEELNVKELEFVQEQSRFISYECKPQLRTLGSQYGANLSVVKQFLTDNGNKVAEFFKNNTDKVFTTKVGNLDVQLKIDDVLISVKSASGFASSSDNGIVVALDTTLTTELLEQGFVRELISKIQAFRKESDFQVTDRIIVDYKTSKKLQDIVNKNLETIKHDTLCQDFNSSDTINGNIFDVNGEIFECIVKVVL
ncbi:MAG: isoleucine--tRNA ligase [Clostridiales bacterium]|jgi:isoleucyl-tRNA synthetase|nr:isoleucine--tRNA ligase [Clostridiales bacterium]